MNPDSVNESALGTVLFYQSVLEML
jgi:hypothetical protein